MTQAHKNTLNKKEIYKGPVSKTQASRFEISQRFDLLEPEFLKAMATIMDIGSKKYGDYNWCKGLTGGKSGINHAIKHITEYMTKTKNDYGPVELHLAQAAVNLMFEYYFAIKGKQNA